jgi:hypothetical protein
MLGSSYFPGPASNSLDNYLILIGNHSCVVIWMERIRYATGIYWLIGIGSRSKKVISSSLLVPVGVRKRKAF